MRRRAVLSALGVAAAGSSAGAAGCLGPLAPDAVRLARVRLHNAAPEERTVGVTVRRAGETVYDEAVVLPADSEDRRELPMETISGEWPSEPSQFGVRIDPGDDGDPYEYSLPDGSKLGRCYSVSATVTDGSEVQLSLTSYASGCGD